MNEEQQPIWKRRDGEPALWYRRFERYLLMFPRRSVAAVFHEEETEKNREKPRKKPTGDWYEISEQWQWEERAEAYDAAQFAEEEKVKQRVFRSGYALQHNRVLALQKQAEDLIAMTADQAKVWVPDVKAIGTGPDAERVDLVNFNAPLFTLIDKLLASIAAEMGERIKKTELTGKDGGPVEYEVDWGGGSLGEKESDE